MDFEIHEESARVVVDCTEASKQLLDLGGGSCWVCEWNSHNLRLVPLQLCDRSEAGGGTHTRLT